MHGEDARPDGSPLADNSGDDVARRYPPRGRNRRRLEETGGQDQVPESEGHTQL